MGCKGIGHVKGPKFATHNTASGCPYSPQNLNKVKTVPDRLSHKYEADFEAEGFEREEKVARTERSERFTRLSSACEERSIKVEKVKREEPDLYDRNDSKCSLTDT